MKNIFLISIVLLISSVVFADGMLIPSNKNYPESQLKNKSTEIKVKINGLVAETAVYQEFENSWTNPVDGVYLFPLPLDARVTDLYYSYRDSLIRAVLKVKQQSTTPGTGEGGVVAEINKYMGNNVLKLTIRNIPAFGVQSIELHYISTLVNYQGTCSYVYPFDTKDFIKYPIDHLKLDIDLKSSVDINSFDLVSHPGFIINSQTNNHVNLTYLGLKEYLTKDIVFNYSVQNNALAIDFYSWKPDTTDGYFTLIGRPQPIVGDTTLSSTKIIVFGNSSTMIGTKLELSKIAINLALDNLSSKDSFNIVLFNSSTASWKSSLVIANSQNIADAKIYINSISGVYGSYLQSGLTAALSQINNSQTLSSIILFTDGFTSFDPKTITTLNKNKTGIFIAAIGNDIERYRLEMLASNNYGFVTYLKDDDNLDKEIYHLFSKLQKPIMKNVNIDFDSNPNVHDVYPAKFPAIYAGSNFTVSGRYVLPGVASIAILGIGHLRALLYKYNVQFNSSNIENEFSKYIWAKAVIDELEARILIEGQSDSLKAKLIALSLEHNMRCRYTAYEQDSIYTYSISDFLDLSELWTDGDKVYATTAINENNYSKSTSLIENTYPNPFISSVNFKIYISSEDAQKVKIIRIYDMNGKCVKVIDLTDRIVFDQSINVYLSANELPSSGFFIVQLQIENEIKNNILINYSK